MDFEEFYPITPADYESLKEYRLRGISQYEVSPTTRNTLSNIKRVAVVGGEDGTPYHRGYIDIWDVWEADQGLFLRHYAHDSTD